MLVPNVVNDPSKVQLARLGHVYFEHPNLNQFRAFARDFGFVEAHVGNGQVYFRGYGIDPYIYVATQSVDQKPRFRGPAFVAADDEEFEKAAKLDGARRKTMNEAPGGGEMVTFERSDGTFFHVVHGQQERTIGELDAGSMTDSARSTSRDWIPSATHEDVGPFNNPLQKPRRGKFQRFHAGPALVHKLGHVGYVHREFDQEMAWYTSNFNFVPSDILYSPEDPGMDILAFIHLDLGDAFSDHHSFFLSRAPPEATHSYVHHTSYEVADVDTQFLGHQWLAAKGWKNVWGVGRHILGSQVFDYWKDPSGFKIEHYADGDVVNGHVETKRDVAGPLSVWGPELPKDFGHDGSLQDDTI